MTAKTRTAVTSTAVLSAVALASSAFAAPPAVASSKVQFLTKSQFPQGERYENWHQTAVKDGLQDPSHFCVEEVLPESRTQFRVFYTDLDAGGVQYVVRAKSTSAAKKLVTKIKDQLPECGERWSEELPDGDYTLKKYPHQDVEDGLSMRGIYTTGDGVENGTSLFGIGRDGVFVTVVNLNQIGTESGAPLTRFTKTAKKGLSQLL